MSNYLLDSNGKPMIIDGLESMTSKMGDPARDKNAGTVFVDKPIGAEQLAAAYENNWIARKIVDVPAYDALREWRIWNTSEARKIEAEEKRLGVKQKVLEAFIKARLFGVAAIYFATDQDPLTPLEPDSVKKGGIKYLTVLTRRELQATDIDRDPMSEYYGKPLSYTITGGTGTSQSADIHPSRLVILTGDEPADSWQMTSADWGGRSVLKATYDTIRNAVGAFSNVASMLFEANVDVIGVPDLMANVGGSGYESDILKRFALAAAGKGINGTLIIDAEESYNRKQVSFNTLPQVMESLALLCAAAAYIPATKFLAQSPSGLIATGDHDMANYHDLLSAHQSLKIGPAMSLFDDCLVRSALGSNPDDINYGWVPLKQMTEIELSEIGKSITESIERLVINGLITAEEGRELAIHKLTEAEVFPHLEQIVEETKSSLDIDMPEELLQSNSSLAHED